MPFVSALNLFLDLSMIQRQAVRTGVFIAVGILAAFLPTPDASCQTPQAAAPKEQVVELPEANPGRPTVSNPATLAPVGYLQFETGTLRATSSPEFSNYIEFNEVIKLAVSPRVEFIESSAPVAHSRFAGVPSNGIGDVFVGAQGVLLPGQGAKPTLAASYLRRVYNGSTPDLDVGSPLNSATLFASADVKNFHGDANAVFNDVSNGSIHRLQFGQTLSISHPITKAFAVTGEIWRFTQPFVNGNALGTLWAASYEPRNNLVFDAGFEKGLTGSSTRWEEFLGLTYVLPHRLWGK
jgi:hypothetical protein